MSKRFLTMEELRELRLQQFDEAVSKVRAILADFDYLNRMTDEYTFAWQNISDSADELWTLKNVAIKIIEP